MVNQKSKIEFKKINVYNKEMSVNLNNLSIEELKKIKKIINKNSRRSIQSIRKNKS